MTITCTRRSESELTQEWELLLSTDTLSQQPSGFKSRLCRYHRLGRARSVPLVVSKPHTTGLVLDDILISYLDILDSLILDMNQCYIAVSTT